MSTRLFAFIHHQLLPRVPGQHTMARTKATAPAKGQPTLNSFFVKEKSQKKDTLAGTCNSGEAQDEIKAGDDVDDVDNNDEDLNTEGDDAAKSATVDKKASPADSHLPPISSIPAIFTDLVSRIPDITKVAERINGRKLRVATMCSGTESPLLALEMIQESIKELFSVELEIDHVFSCEIEPFKQAYIERNFSPPILFRDVCELGEDDA